MSISTYAWIAVRISEEDQAKDLFRPEWEECVPESVAHTEERCKEKMESLGYKPHEFFTHRGRLVMKE